MAHWQYLGNIYSNTKEACLDISSPEIYRKKSMSVLLTTTMLSNIQMKEKYTNQKVEVVNEDVFSVTQKYFGKGSAVVLNMASNTRAGGGVERGAMAQEEELFRRSNYFLSLTQNFYPLLATNVIYTPSVTVIKDEKYQYLEKPFVVSAIAAAALKNPHLKSTGIYSDYDRTVMHTTIDNVFRTAYANGNDILILGALGCGAYNNPPCEVVEIFNVCIQKYWGCFKYVIFAVYSTNIYDKNNTIFSKYIKTKKDTV